MATKKTTPKPKVDEAPPVLETDIAAVTNQASDEANGARIKVTGYIPLNRLPLAMLDPDDDLGITEEGETYLRNGKSELGFYAWTVHSLYHLKLELEK